MTGQNFNQSVRPKRDGTINVYNAFASNQLEHVVLLSPAAGVLESNGQTHYNTGNAFQEGFGLQKVAEQATSDLKTHFAVIQPALITGSDADVTGAPKEDVPPSGRCHGYFLRGHFPDRVLDGRAGTPGWLHAVDNGFRP